MCDYLLNQGLSYSAVNGASCGQYPYICRLLKGIFNRKPPRARYTFTWDPVNVLKHFKAESSSEITLNSWEGIQKDWALGDKFL